MRLLISGPKVRVLAPTILASRNNSTWKPAPGGPICAVVSTSSRPMPWGRGPRRLTGGRFADALLGKSQGRLFAPVGAARTRAAVAITARGPAGHGRSRDATKDHSRMDGAAQG